MADDPASSLSLEKLSEHNKLLGDTDKLQLTDTVLTRAKHFLIDGEASTDVADQQKPVKVKRRANCQWGKGLMSGKATAVTAKSSAPSAELGEVQQQQTENREGGEQHQHQDHKTKQVLDQFAPKLENLTTKTSTVKGIFCVSFYIQSSYLYH